MAVLLFRNVGRVSFPNPTDMFASERKAKFVRVDLMTQQGKSINFKDVAGLKEAKTEVMEFIGYLKHPQKFKVRKERKVGDKRYEARSRGRSINRILSFLSLRNAQTPVWMESTTAWTLTLSLSLREVLF